MSTEKTLSLSAVAQELEMRDEALERLLKESATQRHLNATGPFSLRDVDRIRHALAVKNNGGRDLMIRGFGQKRQTF